MSSFISAQYRLRFLFSAVLIGVLAYLFWTGSRYPALDEKAMMSGAIQLEGVLSFEALVPLTPEMSFVERVFWATINWINTNKKGMTFGVLFAAAFLTLAGSLKRRSFSGGFSNSLLGLVIGAPLGVCVNCAAPIARGMYAGGMRAETVLSAMIASPTLNIVVLTMTFSLLPVWMGVAKIGLSLLVILVAAPLICRLLPPEQRDPAPEIPEPQGWSAEELGEVATSEPLHRAIFGALIGVTISFARNLWYIIRLTVPLMLLAGFLGSLTALLLPQELVTGLSFGIIALIAVAAVGLFLPVPIAFDVVVTGTLLGLGLEKGFVMALLFTLGTFSVYSFFIVAQAVSLRAASLMSAAILVLGVLSGLGAQAYHDWQTRRALELLLGEAPTAPAPLFMAAEAATLDSLTITGAPDVSIETTPLAPPSPPGDAPFTRIEADQRGIDKPLEFSFRDMWPPFWEGRSVASGDIDRDGDIDLVIASTEAGLYIYDNDGAGQFTRRPLPAAPLADWPVFNAALADINNDGWLDLFIATYRAGNHLALNDGAGGFDLTNLQAVANRPDAVMSLALSFGDADRDGDLDVALGNWAAGWYRRIPGEEARNRILWNQGGALDGSAYLDLPAIPGETLSILFSDMDQDGNPDLLVGNDFDIPDAFHMGDGAGNFRQITYQDALIPQTTTTTMAIKTADLTGNGRSEIYLAQIAGRSSGVSETLKMQPLELYCDGIQNPDALATCKRNMEIKTWYKSGNNFDPTYAARSQTLKGRDGDECKAMLVKDLAIQKNDPGICALIPADQPIARSYCDLHFLPARPVTAAEAEASIPQILRSNVLLERGDTAYDDSAETRGLDVGGWSWDTKIEDFDLDGDLDVYIVNGTWVPNEVSPSNLYFENDGAGQFTETSGPMGLEDYLMTASATVFDLEGDGDPDLLSHPVNGPLVLFINNDQSGAGLVVALEDGAGNHDGIGAVITLEDADGRAQRRELQLGGGFMSFDAPEARFALPGGKAAQGLSITWPDGEVTRITGPLHPGQRYLVKRQR